MKTHKLANQLENIAKLLRSLPDSEIDEAIVGLLSLIGGTNQAPKTQNRSPQPFPKGVDERLKTMTPVEIEEYLGSDVNPFSVAQLQDLALRLGISTSKRQGKSALVNLITRHFEASQMDSIIRSSRKDES